MAESVPSQEELWTKRRRSRFDICCLPSQMGYQPPSLNGTLRRLMRESGLLKTAEGKSRTLYSLRHIYASSELLRGGVDTHTLRRQERVDDSLTPLQSTGI